MRSVWNSKNSSNSKAMIQIRHFITSLIITCTCLSVSAQTVYFSGVGRALFSKENLMDESNLQSKLKASGGYTMFDLGIWAEPDEVLRANVILRQRTEFGGFFDNGSSLEFRQMQLEGLIAKKVKYEIGDIYISHTPYTVWNTKFMFNKFESKLFSLRRDIVHYENFFIDNKWRMQGVGAESAIINIDKVVDTLDLRVYGGRTRQTDFFSIPDRYFYGGRIGIRKGGFLQLGANFSGLSDIPGTIEDASVSYSNIVVSSDFKLDVLNSESARLSLMGEAGISNLSLERELDSIANSFDDSFFDVGFQGEYKPWNITFGASFRNVGYNFSSPMAQSRRILGPSALSLTFFPDLNDNLSLRPFTLFDAFTQETSLYNQSISPTLMDYYIQYDMTEPYGKATPNRRGVTLNASVESPSEILKAHVEANLLNEIVSEGDTLTQAKRSFTKINAGVEIAVNELIGIKNKMILTSGYRFENSSRDGNNNLDLTGSTLDLGLEIEVFKNFYLLGGAKLFNAKGTEAQSGRDDLNQIIFFSPIDLDEEQTIYAAGIHYDFDQKSYFLLQYNQVGYENLNVENSKLDISQLFIVYGLKF